MTTYHTPVDTTHGSSPSPQAPAGGESLLSRLEGGTPYALIFGGQGQPWLTEFRDLTVQAGLDHEVIGLLTAAERIVAPVAAELAVARPAGFAPLRWAETLNSVNSHDDSTDDSMSESAMRAAAASIPGILLTQLTALAALRRQGLDPAVIAPTAVAGHSQGILAAAALTDPRQGAVLAFAQLLGAAATIVGSRTGLTATAHGSPMLAIRDIDATELADMVAAYRDSLTPAEAKLAPTVGLWNGRRSAVLSGRPHHLAALAQRCATAAAAAADRRKRKVVGGKVFSPTIEQLPVALAFHHPGLQPAVELAAEWAQRCGLDPQWARDLGAAVLVEPVQWPAAIAEVLESGAQWVLDVGPGDLADRLSAGLLRGHGVGHVAASTPGGQRNLFTPGGAPAVAAPWSRYAPRLVELPGGHRAVDTAFTRLTGRSPIMLAGMTPTTVDPAIVAAAANGGHWAELAGGGQVTESIFAANVERLRQLLHPGRQAQFNTLYLDPYLWKLHVGSQRLLQKARAAGAPLDGVVISAGIPELAEAVALVDELTAAGFPYIAFKPGTVRQIRDVIRIAAETPHTPILVHIEGGRAGGHHSWEDLDDLLVATYAELRERANVVVCVGGGIGTPERAAEYLTGRWSEVYGHPRMPVDAILIGTAAMATAEATTSAAVKQLLVDTPGHPEWIGAGHAAGGMASGRSQLGSDIHEVDNAASRCGRLLDEVAGDAAAVAARRAEIITALDATAKPYFGEVTAMSYGQWLRRYIELAVDDRSGTPEWADVTWQQRFVTMLRQTQARLHPADQGVITSVVTEAEAVADPAAAIARLGVEFPDLDVTQLHPADVAFFESLCRTPGKPVNFVPVIDKDVRRWWRSDSLWQAHDDRYAASQVCVIPGPVAVGGIATVDEPVADLLDRFEAHTAAELAATGASTVAIPDRRLAAHDSPLRLVVAAEHLLWAGRLRPNPVALLGDREGWSFPNPDQAHQESSGATLQRRGDTVICSVPISGRLVRLELAVDGLTAAGGVPRVSEAAAATAMRTLLSIAAAGSLPPVRDGIATAVATLTPTVIADHAAAVSYSFPDHLSPSVPHADQGFANPDAVLGLAWPAIFAVVAAATTPGGQPVVEGVLDLVHLDHSARLLRPLPLEPTDLTLTARLVGVDDGDIGRVVTVAVQVTDSLKEAPVAEFTERLVVLGRGGSDLVSESLPAGGALTAQARVGARKTIRTATIQAPTHMAGFATVTGDHNPIHTDINAARMAGLDSPIAHGMWLSAAAQHLVSAHDAQQPTPGPRAVEGWTARFVGLVRPGATIEVRVQRTGLDRGAETVEVVCTADGELVMTATARLAAPRTVYVFPGQGIQAQGMGMAARAASPAAREVWDRADAHTRAALGFSILAVVRDNPTTLTVRRPVAGTSAHRPTVYSHPDGVLNLTQFTQVAMATLAVAQVAELREQGGFVADAITCGHSVGEYNALAACAEVLPLEAVLEVVFGRGEAMHQLVPRDAAGRSDYRLAAIRPSQCGIGDDEVRPFIADCAAASGEFLEVVNYNLRGSQYAIAGTIAGLRHLEREIDTRRAQFGGKRAFILIPGIDVPFHSSVLRDGVPAFRERLEELLPSGIDPAVLVGKYIPNLVPRLFSLERDFVQEIADLVPSQPLSEVLADFDDWARRPAKLTRTILIELLAWQFASPVRWIETQDLLFTPPERGGLGVARCVEIGLAAAPTLTGLARNTLKLPMFGDATVHVLNAERDAAVLLAADTDPAVNDELDEVVTTSSPHADAPAAGAPPTPVSAPAPTAAGPRPADLVFDPAAAVRVLIALWIKIRPAQIGAADSIESLCDGVSSKRNQLLLDIGSELGLGAIDGAADADLATLSDTVNSLARGYRSFGPVLTDAVADHLRKVLGPHGKRAAYIAERVTGTWELGPGWVQHTLATVALDTREGPSVRGGDLGALAQHDTLDAVIDAAVTAVGEAQGVAVTKPAAPALGGGTVDRAVVDELAQTLTGPDGALATAAHAILDSLGLDNPPPALPVDTADANVIDQVTAELGSDWLRAVSPTFDSRRAVLLDDRWATEREDLARLWVDGADGLPDGGTAERESLVQRFRGAGTTITEHATWWAHRAATAQRGAMAALYGDIAAAAAKPAAPSYASDVAVVTGASSGSIAAAVVGELLAGGATVVATTSQLTEDRLTWFTQLYRNHARYGAALWVVPANLASFSDVDDLIEWIGTEQTESRGGATVVTKPSLTPTLLFPFAAPPVRGELSDAGPRAEVEMRVLLWSVERLIAGLSAIGADTAVGASLHVVLPGSPNRGMFGGDGAYGESKAALDAVVARWSAEHTWSAAVTVVHALIGWVRGTGLMGHNDPLVAAVEAAGVRTWSTTEMATELLRACTPESRAQARTAPLEIDLTAGLATADLDLTALVAAAAPQRSAQPEPDTGSDESPEAEIALLPGPARAATAPQLDWPTIARRPQELVVIVGAAELGPYGSSRTRHEVEVEDRLSAAGVVELAWSTGLITWEDGPSAGWHDTATGEAVAESDLAERYHDAVRERCGIRRYADDGALTDTTAPLLESVYLEQDLTFAVPSEAQARAFLDANPGQTRIFVDRTTGDWQVTRLAGTEIRVPRRFSLSRTVGGQIPTGFDPTRWGIPADMVESVDRVAVWNLVATVDAFLSAGCEPAELLRWVHPTLVANTQGTGMGGMSSMRSLYLDTLLGESKANDILQEALPNVVAAHVVQSYVGSYGSMIHPVAACATAAVSVEEGVDKILVGKALFAVAGGFDDLGIEGMVGFADMSATADTAELLAKGIAPHRVSRANDRRRGGFVESHGGGTVLLARGDVAAQLGLPVLGVVAWAQSFGDGIHTSIPAPGIGALGAARGKENSPLARALQALGVHPDEVSVISKHDTSTAANDPNEAQLHERLADALGRSSGAPLFVVSQKSLTGHAKGGAAAFQLTGLCQILRDGVIPPNRSLDCVDDVMRPHRRQVWPRQPLRFGAQLPLKAGILTSLGFGHVSSLIAVVHPAAFEASLAADQRDSYRERAAERSRRGAQRRLAMMHGGAPGYRKPSGRRLADSSDPDAEVAMLLDPQTRLSAAGTYPDVSQ